MEFHGWSWKIIIPNGKLIMAVQSNDKVKQRQVSI